MLFRNISKECALLTTGLMGILNFSLHWATKNFARHNNNS